MSTREHTVSLAKARLKGVKLEEETKTGGADLLALMYFKLVQNIIACLAGWSFINTSNWQLVYLRRIFIKLIIEGSILGIFA